MMTSLRKHLSFKTVNEAYALGIDQFLILRLLLAMAVVYSHTFYIMYFHERFEPLYPQTGHTLGEHGVNAFFALSGFLITMSWMKRKDPLFFVASRILRIFPALIVAAILSMFVLGASFTTLTLSQYFSSTSFWEFFPKTVLFFLGGTELPGTFQDTPIKFVLATIWTLKFELACYLTTFVLGIIGLFKYRWLVLAGLIAVIVIHVVFEMTGHIKIQFFRNILMFLICYYTGACLYLFGDKMPMSGFVALALFLMAFLFSKTYIFQVIMFMAVSYGALYLALVPNFIFKPFANMKIDLSYGTYIYGWPVGMALYYIFDKQLALMPLFALTAVITLILSYLSWVLVEQPSLKWRFRFMKKA